MTFPFSGDDVRHFVTPTPLPDPYWVAFSPAAASLIDIDLNHAGMPMDSEWLHVLAGNALKTADHQFSSPLASVYSGHQFGVWAGQLGDGRAILLGQIADMELQLKGAGKTRYSRMGDGRAVLRSSIREFLCSEAMHGLGIPTTRALSVIGSKQPIRRETLETAAVCARLAPSFLRVGHFEHFASIQDIEHLKELADDVILKHYTQCNNEPNPYLALFKAICSRNADLVARWQAVGFCHGVLNSDNISVLGLTIDYGPFGFLDAFQIDFICNHSDQAGRYSYHRQPQIMHWNMACLASAFLPLLELTHGSEESQALLRNALEEFSKKYVQSWQGIFRQKLGLTTSQDADISLIERLLQAMHDSHVDYTNFFRSLANVNRQESIESISLRNLFINREQIDQWFADYIKRLDLEGISDQDRSIQMNKVNPKYILRNHLAQRAIVMAQQDDFSEVQKLLKILSHPYDEQEGYEAYAKSPPEDLIPEQISCSS
jgi:serine/tyrosine/threonine adenylyltransferase